MATAIICECSPFHNGHQYLFRTARLLTGEENIAVMSGSFTQRGEVAITDKFTRAGALIRGGADLVIELPTAFAVANAQRFAEGGVTTVTLYKKYSDRGVFSKYGETFKSEWRTGSDITSVYPIASTAQEIKIEGRHYQDVWKEAWNAFDGSSSCKICYRVRFGTSDGKNFDKMIMKPGDELDYREYLENYIYDDIRVEKGVWYSHLEPDETGDLTLSSMKVTAGEKVDYINTPIIARSL